MITAFVHGQKLTLAQTTIAADAIHYLTVRLIYQTAEWTKEDLTVWLHFRKGDTQIDAEVTDGEVDESAGVNLTQGAWSVWLTGHEYEDGTLVRRLTTTTATLTVTQSGITDGEPLPTASFGETILGEVRNIYSDVTEQLNDQNAAVDARLDENEAAVTAMLGKVKNERDSSFIKLWAGTSAQYSAATKSADTIYLIDLLGGGGT